MGIYGITKGRKKMDTAPMFEKGTYIVYVNGDRYEIGRVVSTHPNGAFVCYHEENCAAGTAKRFPGNMNIIQEACYYGNSLFCFHSK